MAAQELAERTSRASRERKIDKSIVILRPTTRKLPKDIVKLEFEKGEDFLLDDIQFAVKKIGVEDVELTKESNFSDQVEIKHDLIYISGKPRLAIREIKNRSTLIEIVPSAPINGQKS